MPGFSSLRVVPFEPNFAFQPDVPACADKINSFHLDDYPRYVPTTITALESRLRQPWPTKRWPNIQELQELHQDIFQGAKPSEWRQGDVRVRLHRPPSYRLVDKYMAELYKLYEPLPADRQRIIEWYTDLETIHPWWDGNGRVGGCAVALLSFHNKLDPQGQFLTPEA